MIDIFWASFGVLGASFCIIAYFLLERGVFTGNSLRYYAMNGIGATLILIASLISYDSGDLGAIVQELCWAAISLMGMIKVCKSARAVNE